MEKFYKKLEELSKAQSSEEAQAILKEIYSIGKELGLSNYSIETYVYMHVYKDSQKINSYLQGRQFFEYCINNREKMINEDPQFGALRFQQGLHDGLRLPEWNEDLKKLSWPFESFPLPTGIIVELVKYLNDNPNLQEYKKELQAFLDALPREIYPRNFFFKVGSISPKGGEDPFGFLGDMVLTNKLNFKDAEEIIKGMTNSLRIQQELEEYYFLKQDTTLIIRPFLELEKRNEFRVFVFKSKWIGTSQMFCKNCFSYTEVEKESIIAASKKLVEQINPNLEINSYVIDMYLEGDLSDPVAKMIELNPFAPTTDPILFKDQIFDCSLKVVEE